VDRFLPDPGTEDLDDLYLGLELPAGDDERPHVALGMVTSVDGAAAVGGTSGSIGGEADGLAYRRLREHVDVILVGAGTVRAEAYGPPAASPDRIARRRERGLADLPEIAVVTSSLDLDPELRLFGDPERRPLLVTVEDAPADRRQRLAEFADVLVAGRGRVDLPLALRRLAERGVRRVLCEGGPALNAQLVAAGLADELFVTLAPWLVGETSHRIVEGALGDAPVALRLRELRHHESELLLRYAIG
jgi:riboflavin-specific deaminase-like protein